MRKFGNMQRTAAAMIVLAAAAHAFAQAYPTKPIRLIVPFPPGGAVDYYARVVQQPLSEMLGQSVVVENKAGASGMVGAEAVARAAPDGYTLLLGNIASLAINVGIYPKMAYDPLKDLTPIVRTVDVNTCWWCIRRCLRRRCPSLSPTRKRIRASSRTARQAVAACRT